jgi:hypothetical protein
MRWWGLGGECVRLVATLGRSGPGWHRGSEDLRGDLRDVVLMMPVAVRLGICAAWRTAARDERLLVVHRVTPWMLVALLAGAVACGRTAWRTGRDAAGAGEAIDTTSPDVRTSPADARAQAQYAGVVLAMVTQDQATTSYVARAVFTTGARPIIGGCPHCCCGSEERGLPIPQKPADAGNMTLATSAGATALATLVPAAFEGGSGTFYGMSDLGWSWLAPLSDYAPVTSQPWSPGDALSVLATGNEVEPFAGVLQTGPALAGVTPPIGPSPVVVDYRQAFEVSWTPEGKGDATVLLSVPYSGGICFCDAPDAAGKLVVDADLLGPLSLDQNGKISLARLTISTVTTGNATIDLVGADVRVGPIAIE